jgi:hypothetical protein
VSDNESATLPHPFDRWFVGDDRPRFVGLSRDEAEERARNEGLATRVLELPATGSVLWRGDLRSDRVNLVVEAGRVIPAQVF